MSDATTVQTIKLEKYTVTIVKDSEGKFWWKVTATNTQGVGMSEQGFASHAYCLQHLQKLATIISSPEIMEATVMAD
jgi:uncharacterized protein YegP (UPF0339 family)